MTPKPPRKHRSYWLEQVAGDQPDAPPLKGALKTDIAIVGGGYVGLWTAIRIKQQDPSCEVSLIEMDICGGGASGRNGGFALSWWPKISSLVRLCGREEGAAIAKDSQAAIDEIQRFCGEHHLDVQFKKSGWLWTATSNAQINAWESVASLCENLGVDVFRRLPPDEIARRSGSCAHRAGIVDTTAAMLHPARLARGLRKVALERGVRIFEHTKVLSFTRTRPVKIKVPEGLLTADKLIIANNAWAAGITELARRIVPITSDMIMTAPAKTAIEKTGWTGGEGITDSQVMVDYYRVTEDSRIAFGKGGWGIAFGGSIGDDFDRNTDRAKTVEADFRRYYPELKDVAVTHDWCGPIDRTPNSLPLMGRFERQEQIIYGVGWSGNGVGPSVIGGKVLASLALGRDDRWARYPLVQKSVGLFPPEPIRYIGAHIVRTAVACKERAEIEDKKPSWLATRLSSLAPKGLEDKE
ncbi:MAG: FAD-dependent oxidoreductase [Elusimicrobia bacterium]|nr:FAD-dependent oxidoreductase [Elusimicrobiota bacterium]